MEIITNPQELVGLYFTIEESKETGQIIEYYEDIGKFDISINGEEAMLYCFQEFDILMSKCKLND